MKLETCEVEIVNIVDEKQIVQCNECKIEFG